MKKKLIPYFLVAQWIIVSCISRPDYVLDEDTMVSLLTDVHRSEGLLELQQDNKVISNDEAYKQAVMAAVLVKHHVTRAQYDSSLVWYGQNLSYLVKVYNKVQKNLIDDIDYWKNVGTERESKFDISMAGDSVELWSIENYLTMDERRFGSFRFWEIPTDSNFVKGDSLIWHLHVPYVPESHILVATLSFDYEDILEMNVSHSEVARQDTSISMSLRSDTTVMFKSIIASVALLKDSMVVDDNYAFIDSLSLIRIHR